MKQLKNIAIPIATYVLLIALFFPSFTEFSHIFENHEHSFCGNVNTHLHEQDIDCDLGDYHYNLYNFKSHDATALVLHVPEDTSETLYVSQTYSSLKTTSRLRGPPLFQQDC